MLMTKIKIAFVNPPHADWSLANNAAYLMFQSYYARHGHNVTQVEWLTAPYKFNQYNTVEDIYQDGIQEADIYLFSSYVWNYDIIDRLAEHVKVLNPNALCVLGGPQIGTNDPKLLSTRSMYDFILKPTKPGEVFVQELIDSYIATNGKPNLDDISWELRSFKKCSQFMPDYSVYEEHYEFLKESRDYAIANNIESFMILETTRGCPYQCSFCEWGGGIGSKIYKKPTEVVEKDILALKKAGYTEAFLTDANFGAFLERDLTIFKFGWENGVKLTDISTMKSKDLDRRIKLVDAWFSVIGINSNQLNDSKMFDPKNLPMFVNTVPSISIQSVSEVAMKIANRIDLSLENKIKLSEHINKRCHEEGYPIPNIELIMGMPGSTLEDFYREMTILWNFKAWNSQRHDYMFLPDSELSRPEYLKRYNIELVEVYVDVVDDSGVDNSNSLYRKNSTYYKTIASCFSFTREQAVEMWIMNIAGNYLLEHLYESLSEFASPNEFGKACFNVMKRLDGFDVIWNEAVDILNPDTPARNIKRLQGRLKIIVMEEFIDNNKSMIYSEVFRLLVVEETI
jgi:putative methyltransferase